MSDESGYPCLYCGTLCDCDFCNEQCYDDYAIAKEELDLHWGAPVVPIDDKENPF